MIRADTPAPRELARRQAIRDAAKRMREGEGFLYVAEVIGTDTVKIGYALDIEKRRRALKQDYFMEFRMLASMPATIMQEKALHRRLRRYRNRGSMQSCATEFYHRSILLNPAIPAELLGAA